MIDSPRNFEEFQFCREFLRVRGSIETPSDAHIILWRREEVPVWVVSFSCWNGYTCILQIAGAQKQYPRALKWAIFNYAFNIIKRKEVYALIASSNKASLRLALWHGMREFHRAENCCEDHSSDIIFLVLKATEWRANGGSVRYDIRRRQLVASCA